MPNNFTGHIDKWLLLSESETDFAILFVRAWIPFNAWYCNNYGSTKDRTCIDQIKIDGNQFRARLVALLTGTNADSKRFRTFLGQLHELLEAHPIPDADPAKRISFINIYYRTNPKTVTNPTIKRRNLEYKVEKLSNDSIVAIVVNTTSVPPITKYTYSHIKYDYQHFSADILATNLLNADQKEILKNCFLEIDPKRKENLIVNGNRHYLEAGGVYFINNSDLLSQAIIDVLYSLRCKLFHGELQPSRDNLSIYEPAYYILRILSKSLK
jgi:hypothetical protein